MNERLAASSQLPWGPAPGDAFLPYCQYISAHPFVACSAAEVQADCMGPLEPDRPPWLCTAERPPTMAGPCWRCLASTLCTSRTCMGLLPADVPGALRSPWYGAERPKFLGPLEAEYPPWLRGEAPADYGFDPLALGREPAAFERNFELEILHARWAMLGALGALVPGAPRCLYGPTLHKPCLLSRRTLAPLVVHPARLWG